MNDNYSSTIIDECDSVVKIVLAGTIASGKTTLLGALSAYEEGKDDDNVHVKMYFPDEVDREDYERCLKFRRDAVNCFNNTPESPSLGYNPWLGATVPDEVPKEIWLEIATRGGAHKLSFFDFAGETFLDAFDTFYNAQHQQKIDTEQERARLREQAKESIRDVVGKLFNAAIADAHIVLIVVSCKDIIDFQSLLQRDRDYAERMQFAYSFMMARAEELQRTKKGRRVFLVITQCDQYKALLSRNMELVENGLKGLLADASCSQIERIYTSSAYQTELKAIKIGDANSKWLKFCPTMRRCNDQPSSLGIKTLVGHICNVSKSLRAIGIEILKERLGALTKEFDALTKESDGLKKKFAALEESAKCATEEAQKIIKVMEKDAKKFWESLYELRKDRDSVVSALKDIEGKIQECGNDIGIQDCGNKETIQDCSDDVNEMQAAINGMEAAIRGVRAHISSMRDAIKVGKLDITKRVHDLDRRIEVERRKVGI